MVKTMQGQLVKLPFFHCRMVHPRLYTEAMPPENFTDLTQCSFEAFADFLFDRTAPSGEDSFADLARRGETHKWDPWYYDAEVSFDSLRLCTHYSQLFR